MNSSIYTYLVPLVSYPESDIRSDLENLNHHLDGQKAVDLKIFHDHVNQTKLTKLQEEFTHSFDLSPNTCLDLGWHLHGENYERGVFMVHIREMLREFQIPETSELPDHLTHILSVLPKMEEEDRLAFIKFYVLPATGKIVEGFGEEENPYKHLIQFINDVLLHQIYSGEVQA